MSKRTEFSSIFSSACLIVMLFMASFVTGEEGAGGGSCSADSLVLGSWNLGLGAATTATGQRVFTGPAQGLHYRMVVGRVDEGIETFTIRLNGVEVLNNKGSSGITVGLIRHVAT